MRRAPGELQILRAASVIAAVLLIVTVPACKKRTAPAPSTPQPQAAPPAPPSEPPTETVKEAPIPPNTATETAEDIDDTIRQQNASRSLLHTVYFAFDQYEIKDDQVPTLQANAAWLKAHAQYKVVVEGHADERDTIEYNLALGERRAKAVLDYLVDLGVPASRLRKISYGEERPVDLGHDETAWAKNRRAEFTLEK